MAVIVNEALKDLVIINHDRYQGYKRAAEETEDADLRMMFTEWSTQSLGFANELKKHVDAADARDLDPDDTTVQGKLYRVYMDLKAAVLGRDRKAILSSCEYGDDAALKEYKEALDDVDGDYSSAVKILIQEQRNQIQQSHDRVKMMRDAA